MSPGGHRHRIRPLSRPAFSLAIIVIINTLGGTLNTKFGAIKHGR